ncbi:MAG TPA: hypothetical protein VGC07_03535 [Granulicella sp.]
MDTNKKLILGGSLLFVVAIGVRVGMMIHERNAPVKAPVKQEITVQPDELVFLKKKRQDSLPNAKELIGSTLWVSAAGQMEYYPYANHKADFGKKAGILLGAEQLLVKDAFEQAAPKSATFRIPGGDKQVLLAFTLPKSDKPDALYAVPVGYHEGGRYTFQIDEIFFYDDPHTLYAHWGPEVWKAIDSHTAIKGMSEHQTQMALGQVSQSPSTDQGNRTVVYDNLGHPVSVTFEKDHATSIEPQSK